jgi:hypothetical protein
VVGGREAAVALGVGVIGTGVKGAHLARALGADGPA